MDPCSSFLAALALAPAGEGTPSIGVRVNPVLAPGEDVNRVRLMPDGREVILEITQEGFTGGQLWRVSALGLRTPLALIDPVPTDRDFYDFRISPDGSRIAFTAQLDTVGQYELYGAPTDGSRTVVKLSHVLGPTEDVFPSYFVFTADGQRVVYEVGNQVHGAPADGSQPAVPLSDNLVTGLFRVAPVGQRVVYRSFAMHSVPADGSAAPVRLGGLEVVGSPSTEFQISPDGQWVVFWSKSYRSSGNTNRVYSVPIDGSGPAILLFDPITNGPLYPNAAPMLHVSADSRWVVMRSDASPQPHQLYSAPIDGSAPQTRLSPPVEQVGGNVGYDFRFAPDGRVVFLFQSGTALVRSVWVAPVDGAVPAQEITPSDAFPHVVKFEVTATGRAVFDGYTPSAAAGDYEIYSAPLVPGSVPVRLNPPMVPGGDLVNANVVNVPSFVIGPDGRWVAYLADQDTDGVTELYLAPTDGSRPASKRNGALAPGGNASFLPLFTHGGRRLLYQADQVEDALYEVFTSEVEAAQVSCGAAQPIPRGRGIH